MSGVSNAFTSGVGKGISVFVVATVNAMAK